MTSLSLTMADLREPRVLGGWFSLTGTLLDRLHTLDLLKSNACYPSLGEMRYPPTTKSWLQYTAPHGALDITALLYRLNWGLIPFYRIESLSVFSEYEKVDLTVRIRYALVGGHTDNTNGHRDISRPPQVVHEVLGLEGFTLKHVRVGKREVGRVEQDCHYRIAWRR
jgi:hypothetical protein